MFSHTDRGIDKEQCVYWGKIPGDPEEIFELRLSHSLEESQG